jgi:hypothetical protein
VARPPRGGPLSFFAFFFVTKTLQFSTNILGHRNCLRTIAIIQMNQRKKAVSLSPGQSHRRDVIYAQAVRYPR